MILSDTFFCTLFSFFCGNCTLFSGAICGRRLMCCLHRTCSARCGCSFCFLFVSETISVNQTIGLLAKEEPVCWQLHACMDLAMSEVFYTSHVFGRGQICLAPEDIFDVLLCCLQNLASSKFFLQIRAWFWSCNMLWKLISNMYTWKNFTRRGRFHWHCFTTASIGYSKLTRAHLHPVEKKS